jgi:hypothetical protein
MPDKNTIAALEHQPHSLDLSPPDFFLFPQQKKSVLEERLACAEETTAKATRSMTEVSKNSFRERFQKFYEHDEKMSLYKGIIL